MTRTVWTVLTLMALVLLRAASAQTPIAPPPPTAPTTAPAPSAVPAAPVLTLLDAGTGEKRELRYAFATGAESHATMLVKVSTSQVLGESTLPGQVIPSVRLSVRAKTLSVNAAGEATFEFTVSKVELVDDPAKPSPLKEVLQQSLSILPGTTGVMVVSERGELKFHMTNVPPGADGLARQQLDSLRDNLGQLCPPLPAEPVGVGASWRTEQRLSPQGMRLDQVTTMRLMSIKGDALDLEWNLKQHAGEQHIEDPVRKGVTTHLKSLESTADAKASHVLNSVFALKVAMTVETATVVEMARMGEVKTVAKMSMDAQGGPGAPTP